ncbi:hypothetical protein X798_06482 [Onchocerca flexuosa]|uniref:Lipoprotein n=2 Tax=Onchocerca flexuosa TaxID=387005 RepID=A0A183HW60_9BILA|nr:hypothetical protein X798_06482 [Onchocerca flexuosa]VDO78639.1 unnamed protein product [Onchocerca flexuosa]
MKQQKMKTTYNNLQHKTGSGKVIGLKELSFRNGNKAEHEIRASLSFVTAVEAGTQGSAGDFSDDGKSVTEDKVRSVKGRTVPGIIFFSLRFSPRARRSFSAHFAALSTC